MAVPEILEAAAAAARTVGEVRVATAAAGETGSAGKTEEVSVFQPPNWKKCSPGCLKLLIRPAWVTRRAAGSSDVPEGALHDSVW